MNQLAYSPYKFKRSNFQPINKDVIVVDMSFEERTTHSGLILRNDNGTGLGIRPRWGQVYAVGPDQTNVSVGNWICVAHGRWTRGLEIEDENGEHTIRKIDPNDILLVSETLPEDETFSSAIHVDKQSIQ
jgi:co-chaperonin GroES (HSP10)